MRFPRFFKKNKKATIALVLLGVTIVVLCQLATGGWFRSTPYSSDEIKRLSTRLIGPRKQESLERWKSLQIGEESATEFTLARTSLVVAGEIPLDNLRLTIGGGRNASPGRSDSKSEKQNRPFIGYGTATAITSDGYWLTAAHVVDPAHVYLASIDREKLASYPVQVKESHPVRIVWTGATDDPSVPDLALIYCSHLPVRHFPLSRPPILSPDAEVLAAGSGGGEHGLSGGRILLRGGNKGSKSGPRWRVYLNDAPVVPGDSGGPLLNAQGQLLGINASVHFSARNILGWKYLRDYRSRTICPDTGWIRKLILADRAESKRKSDSESDSKSNSAPSHPPIVSVVAESVSVVHDR